MENVFPLVVNIIIKQADCPAQSAHLSVQCELEAVVVYISLSRPVQIRPQALFTDSAPLGRVGL